MSATETFDLPECYDGPVLIQKDSSDIHTVSYTHLTLPTNDLV